MVATLIWIVGAAVAGVLVLLLPRPYFEPAVLPLLVALALYYLILGFASMLAPRQVRRLCSALLKPGTVRVVGLIALLIGAALVRAAKETEFPLFVQIVGALAFVEGAVLLVSPMVAITVAEWWLDLSNTWIRLQGIVCLALAGLFLVAVGYIRLWEKEPVLPPDLDSEELVIPLTPTPATAPATGATPASPPVRPQREQ